MIWALLAAGFFVAATMGAAVASLLTTIRPEWPRKRRLLTAASVLPAITLVAGLGVAILGCSTSGPMMRGAIFLVILAWAAGFALLGFVGGFLGALTSARARLG
jgi:hypothetical protein